MCGCTCEVRFLARWVQEYRAGILRSQIYTGRMTNFRLLIQSDRGYASLLVYSPFDEVPPLLRPEGRVVTSLCLSQGHALMPLHLRSDSRRNRNRYLSPLIAR